MEPEKAAVYVRFGKSQDVALYCRTALADSDALSGQALLLRNYANANGYSAKWVEHHVYLDSGVSGLSMARPGMDKLMRDIQAGAIRTVIAKDVSRISRSCIHFMEWLAFLKKHDVQFVSVCEGEL